MTVRQKFQRNFEAFHKREHRGALRLIPANETANIMDTLQLFSRGILCSWRGIFSWKNRVRESRVIGPTTRTSVALELGPPLNMATDGPGD
ncbi:hypothetical protein ANTQUA_LOCUS430 [Anthophora quadrimaculata]